MTTSQKATAILLTSAGIGLTGIAQIIRRPTPPNPTVLSLRTDLENQVKEFSALEIGRFVPPKPIYAKDGTLSGYQLLDRYSSDLEQGTHKLEDTAIVALSIPLYDLAVARTPENRTAAAAHVQHGLASVRQVLDQEFGRGQLEYNEADVLARLRGTLFKIEALPDVRK